MTNQRIALVTGANRGIGLEATRQLALKGITVLLGARDAARGEAAAEALRNEGGDVHFLRLDMTSADDIRHAHDHIAQTYGHLDILINNAGIQIELPEWIGNTTTTIAPDILRKTFDVNFFGVVELTQALLPLLRKSDAGRIVNMTSILGSLGLHSDPASPIAATKTFAYNASKTALNQFTIHLADALKDTAIKVNAAHPGWVRTDMGTEAAPMLTPEGAKTAVDLALVGPEGPNGQYLHLGDALPW